MWYRVFNYQTRTRPDLLFDSGLDIQTQIKDNVRPRANLINLFKLKIIDPKNPLLFLAHRVPRVYGALDSNFARGVYRILIFTMLAYPNIFTMLAYPKSARFLEIVGLYEYSNNI